MGLKFRSSGRYSKASANAPYASLQSFNHDGLELARRKREKRREFPVRQVFLFVLAIVSFKIFLFLDMGGGAYGAKMEDLANGSTMERLASKAMTLDPVSKWLVDGIRFGRW